MHPDFFKVEDGLKDWQVFQDSMSRQAEEREEAMNQRAAQGLDIRLAMNSSIEKRSKLPTFGWQ